jgi:hypothetical protein
MKTSWLAFVVVLCMGFGQAATVATASSDITGEEIRAFDFGYNGAPQGDREAGPYGFTFTNTDPTGAHEIIIVRMASANVGATNAKILAAIDKGPTSLCPTGCFFDAFGGFAFTGPLSTTPGFGFLSPGRYAYFCAVPEADGTRHYKLGMFGTFWAK